MSNWALKMGELCLLINAPNDVRTSKNEVDPNFLGVYQEDGNPLLDTKIYVCPFDPHT